MNLFTDPYFYAQCEGRRAAREAAAGNDGMAAFHARQAVRKAREARIDLVVVIGSLIMIAASVVCWIARFAGWIS